MFSLPPPSTFAEGMRLLFALAAIVFGVAVGLGLVALTSVLIWGGWPASLFPKIISIIGWIAIGALSLLAITQIGILLGGPVGRFKGGVGKDGVQLEASADDEQTPVVTTTTTTTVPTGGSNVGSST